MLIMLAKTVCVCGYILSSVNFRPERAAVVCCLSSGALTHRTIRPSTPLRTRIVSPAREFAAQETTVEKSAGRHNVTRCARGSYFNKLVGGGEEASSKTTPVQPSATLRIRLNENCLQSPPSGRLYCRDLMIRARTRGTPQRAPHSRITRARLRCCCAKWLCKMFVCVCAAAACGSGGTRSSADGRDLHRIAEL